MRPEFAIQLIKRVAGERARRARIPRRSMPSFPAAEGDALAGTVQEGSPGVILRSDAQPPLNAMIGSRPVTFNKVISIRQWPEETDGMIARIGKPQPVIQRDENAIVFDQVGF